MSHHLLRLHNDNSSKENSPKIGSAMENTISPPPRWGEDELTKYLDSVRKNHFVTFAKKIPETKKMIEIDGIFLRVIHVGINTRDLTVGLLMHRAHSAYRAAASCAFAGQSAELYPLLRLMLEQGGYAILINRKPELEEVWLNRQESDAARNKVRREFKPGKIKDTIASSDPRLNGIFCTLYEKTIDFGAHPNEMSVTGGITIKENENQKDFKLIYLHGDGLVLDHSLRTLAQVGVCVLLIFQEIFREQFELSGVSSELLKLQKSL